MLHPTDDLKDAISTLIQEYHLNDECRTPTKDLTEFLYTTIQAFSAARKYPPLKTIHPIFTDGTTNFSIDLCPSCNQTINNDNYCRVCGIRVCSDSAE
jgi:hypothetical protein